MNLGISIVIATYNGKDRLANTLMHLRNQKLSCPTEIILVDNASTDGTKQFADKWWKNNGVSYIDYSSYQQPIPGKSYAQDLGYSKAKYKYLLVCDDDNWLCNDYVQTAFEIMESNSEIGALGGWCEAVFESEKPDWFDTYAKYFAVSKQGTDSGDVTHKKGCLYGAGMVIKKSHWVYLNKLGFKPLLTCRKGNTLASGGDTEYSYVLRLLGYKMWFDERLYFKHFMTKGRLNLNYVSRIRKAMSESNFVVSAYVDKLNNQKQTSKRFKRKFLSLVKHKFIKNVAKRLVGNFEQKEQAKEYFRQLKRLLFSYKAYETNYKSIDKWLTNHI
ncbi:glycosyltransferase [Flavobacterium sp. CS20]|uniref:glycosyltransferase n=1 Tax=Flavobacterium sp. CS20 TaxID=2775246 RepID=UPI001B39D3AF|nr:glycosyltransferase [Flavobacterium sp. CS20]QTY27709.1 glycosyltransferase family 2 protein [Flavobacterium sp. CS20]